jgi:hypothetical protein
MCVFVRHSKYRGRILGRNWDKSLSVFPLTIHGHLCIFALRFLFLQLTQPLTVSTAQLLSTVEVKGGKPSLRNLKIVPRNISETVSS